MLIFDQLKKDDPQLRLLTAVVLCGLAVLLVGLWWTQVVRSRSYQAHLENQSLRTVRVPAMRGRILDRNGEVLAENQPSYTVGLYLEDLRDQFKSEYQLIRPVKVVTNSPPFWERLFVSSTVSTQRVRLKAEEIARLEEQARYAAASNLVGEISRKLEQPISLDPAKFSRYYATARPIPYTVIDDLNSTQVARFEERLSGMVGADLEIRSERTYPHGSLAAHVLGYLRLDDGAFDDDQDYSYRLPDYQGVIGIEGYFDQQLRGQPGSKSVLVNNLGYRQSETVWSDARPGSNVVLTLDVRIQKAAETALYNRVGKNVRGAVVVMDVNTGDLLALVSAPAVGPNSFIDGFSREDLQLWYDQKMRVQRNRATQENYAPGSIFKTVVGLAALEGGLDPSKQLYNPGYIYIGRRYINDLAPAGDYDFRRALLKSSNTYFITNGLRYAGVQNIIKLGQRLHLGERSDLPTWQDTPGSFPTAARVRRSDWTAGYTANLCIGQGEIAVTPLQMAVLTCAIANGGKVLLPRLVDRIEPQDPMSGDEPFVFERVRVRDELGVHPRNLEILREAMLADTEDPEGTAYQAFTSYYRSGGKLRVCGKTGTAQVMDEQNRVVDHDTWFISFAPYERPRYAVVVMVESGGSGGGTCAPVAQDIYTAIQKISSPAGNQNLVKSN